MTARYPLVLNGTSIEELQIGDGLIGVTSGNAILAGDGSGGIKNIALSGSLSFDGVTLNGGSSLPATATTAEMQAGTETALRSMSPSLVKDAVVALATPRTAGTTLIGSSSTTSTSPTASALSVSITPSKSTSSIRVIVNACIFGHVGTSNSSHFRLYRNGVAIGSQQNLPNSTGPFWLNFSVLDSPGTTSAVTYALYMWCDTGAGAVGLNQGSSNSSCITAIEVSQ